MILLVAATALEAGPFLEADRRPDRELLLGGVGLLETAVRLGRRLDRGGISMVINFGVAGAYPGSGAALLDLCLAEREVLGDLGLCYGERIVPLPEALTGKSAFGFDAALLDRADSCLGRNGFSVRRGTFVTVCGVSATARRGALLQAAHQGLCENMEGAAVARVCEEFAIPCLELRSVSNLVEDRDPGCWRLAEATERCAGAVACLLNEFAGPEG